MGEAISGAVSGMNTGPVLLLIGITLVFLLLGMFLEPIGAMLLTLPIVLPIIQAADLSLVWFGVVLTKLLEIGMLTPPIGMNVFVIKGVVGNQVSTTTIFKGVMWFLLADMLVLTLITVFPEVVLALPRYLLS